MTNGMQISNGNFTERRQFQAAASRAASSQARTPSTGSRESLPNEIEAVRGLLDQGLSSEAEKRSRALIKTSRRDASILAKAHCFLSVALEMQGRYRESLDVMKAYEPAESHRDIDAEALALVRVHIGLAYNYTGDQPKAIAVLNTALRESSESGSAAQLGAIYVALARVYRSINEYKIARDHALSALEHYRRTGDWRGLAESYFGLALAELFEGKHEIALSNFDQALKLVGDNPAPYLLGKIHTNMAGALWFLKRTQEVIGCLEKAIGYYESTEHKATAADGYNNLGMSLILVGDWDRAQQALDRALLLTAEIDEQDAKVPMVLDSLGQLKMLRGEFAEAQSLLQRAVSLATEHGNKWYARQALYTLGRCRLAMNDSHSAREHGEEALALAEAIGDRQAVSECRLMLAEVYLRSDQLDRSIETLREVSEALTDSTADIGIVGEAERLNGLIAMAQADATRAAQHFARTLSIFEMLGDRYRSAIASAALGIACASSNARRAADELARARETFLELGAGPDLATVEQALAALDRDAPERQRDPLALMQLLTARLADAAVSRELLLRELAALLRQESNAERIMIVEPRADGEFHIVVASGFRNGERQRLAADLQSVETERAEKEFGLKHNAHVISLKPRNAPPAKVVIAPRGLDTLTCGLTIEPLLRVATLGLEVCSLRELTPEALDSRAQSTPADQTVLPGFIYSSPAMTRLVEEMHKIRSSDVTVLVTGESGTGKELVARGIHQLSSRRSRVFVPFNCTAVPKELSEAYLFGYKRGSFTGATSDSPGVIRTAAGGTLFLDEIGDLPLDLQPKLLRFLQEGEIQPLGEQRPTKVDVRIIAATNTDLERMVAEGRFREDLYYRLNVIRLQVPPLRDRRSEIPTIVNHYIDHYSEKFGRRDIKVTSQTMDLLMVCDWPGNVRQVCNEVQRVVARAEDGTVITPEHLSPELGRISSDASEGAGHISAAFASTGAGTLPSMNAAIEELERRMIADALHNQGGNVTRAARELGITRRGLQLKLARYAISATASGWGAS